MSKVKLTVAQKIHARKIKKPPTVIYRILAQILMLFLRKILRNYPDILRLILYFYLIKVIQVIEFSCNYI